MTEPHDSPTLDPKQVSDALMQDTALRQAVNEQLQCRGLTVAKANHDRLNLPYITLLWIIIALMLFIMAYSVILHYRKLSAWSIGFEQHYTQLNQEQQARTLEQLSFTDRGIDRPSQIHRFTDDGIALPSGHWLWIEDLQVYGDVRVDMVVHAHGEVDSVELAINSMRKATTNWWSPPPGYLGKVNITNTPEPQSIIRTEGDQSLTVDQILTVDPNKPTRITMQRKGDRVTMAINDHPPVVLNDAFPLTGTGLDGIGVRIWKPSTTIQSIRISRRTLPEVTSPLIAGDELASLGHLEDAVRTYRHIAADYKQTPIGEKALAKAYLVASRLNPEQPNLRKQLYEQFTQQYPDADFRTKIMETESLCTWRNGQYEQAFAIWDHLLKINPDSQIATITARYTRQDNLQLPESVAQRLLKQMIQHHQGKSLKLDRLGICDLSPIAGMNITDLRISNNHITSLEPIKRMALQSLNCADNQIADLSPLANMPLRKLNARNNRISDLKPLTNLPLEYIDLTGNQIVDIQPLAKTPVSDLHITENQIQSLAPCAQMNQLSALSASSNQIDRLDDLAQCRNLKTLHLANNQISNLAPLAEIALTTLNVSKNQVRSLQPLKQMTSLSQLSIAQNQIDDLTPLQSTQLQILHCQANRITSLLPLAALPLTQLDCADNPVTTLQPLAGKNMNQLNCSRTRITTLQPFYTQPPNLLIYDDCPISDDMLQQAIVHWSQHNETKTNAHLARVRLALRQRDLQQLKQLATPVNGTQYLAIPLQLTWQQAKDLADSLDAQLLCLDSYKQMQRIGKITRAPQSAWLGLVIQNRQAHWVNNKPLTFQWFKSNFNVQQADYARALLPATERGRWNISFNPEQQAGAIFQWQQTH